MAVRTRCCFVLVGTAGTTCESEQFVFTNGGWEGMKVIIYVRNAAQLGLVGEIEAESDDDDDGDAYLMYSMYIQYSNR